MELKLNCWEFKKCGRQPHGPKAVQLGVCPAATQEGLDGIHNGTNGGRACWVIAGTFCGGEVQGTYANKSTNCRQCDFYQTVLKEEGELHSSFSMLTMLK